MMQKQQSEEPSKRYDADDIIKARQAMLNELANISDGRLLEGCCTQDCCNEGAQALFTGVFQPTLYTKQDLIHAQRAMLKDLAELSGGVLLAGCCTQGCCDSDAIDWVVNPAPFSFNK